MQIFTIPVGYLQANCYIVEAGGQCLVIDPGWDGDRLCKLLESTYLMPDAILLTHGHFDHVGAVVPLVEHFHCPVYLHQEDHDIPNQVPKHFFRHYGEDEAPTFRHLPFQVLHTPGHTPGSVCLLFENNLFTGDVLFAGTCGRTDLPGGDPAAMTASLRRLARLEKNYKVYPGHGEPTELDYEKRYNMYLR